MSCSHLDRSRSTPSSTRNPTRAPASRIAAKIVLALFVLGSFGCADLKETPPVEAGFLDLSSWDFESSGVVPLEGEWEICWNAYVSPESGLCPETEWQSFPVPRLWSDASVRSPIGGYGIASYRAIIELPPRDGLYTLRAGSPMSAYRLWINGVPMGGAGEVGLTAESVVPKLTNLVYPLPSDASRIEILVHVANFEFRGGGLRRTWFVGPSRQIEARNNYELLAYAGFAATMFALGAVFLAQFAFRPSELARAWLGLFALLIGLRMAPASTSDLSQLLTGWASFDLVTRLEYINSSALILVATAYLRDRVPGVMPRRMTGVLLITTFALVPMQLFGPLWLTLATLPVLLIIAPIMMLLGIVEYGRAYRAGVRDTGTTMFALTVFLLGVLHDALRTQTGLGISIEIFPYFALLWLAIEAFALLKNYSGVYAKVEALSEELQDANYELQETEASIVRFVPFDLLRLLGKESVRDVEAGDHALVDMSVIHISFAGAPKISELAKLPNGIESATHFVERLERCAHRHGGFMSGYLEDGIQLFFPGSPVDAVSAALEMLAEARGTIGRLDPSVQSGTRVFVGVHTGPVMIAMLGGSARLIEGLDGSPVHLAPRIAALAEKVNARLLISASTREGLDAHEPFEIRGGRGLAVESNGDKIEVFEVVGTGCGS